MNACLLPLPPRTLLANARPGADRSIETALDLRHSRIHVETDRGLVTAFYLDSKPRRDVIVVPLGAGHWRGGEPTQEVTRHARLLIDSGVSVLLVDVRWHEGWRGRLLGRTRKIALRGALDYLVARGHEASDSVVDAMG